jgi:hypothetical protein
LSPQGLLFSCSIGGERGKSEVGYCMLHWLGKRGKSEVGYCFHSPLVGKEANQKWVIVLMLHWWGKEANHKWVIVFMRHWWGKRQIRNGFTTHPPLVHPQHLDTSEMPLVIWVLQCDVIALIGINALRLNF